MDQSAKYSPKELNVEFVSESQKDSSTGKSVKWKSTISFHHPGKSYRKQNIQKNVAIRPLIETIYGSAKVHIL